MRSIVFTGIGGRPVFARGQCGSRSAPAPPTAPPSLQGTGACASSSSRGSTPVRVASSSCPWRWPPQLTRAQANTMGLQMFLSGEPSPIPPYPRARATVHLAAPRRDRPSSVEPAANPVGVPRARTSRSTPSLVIAIKGSSQGRMQVHGGRSTHALRRTAVGLCRTNCRSTWASAVGDPFANLWGSCDKPCVTWLSLGGHNPPLGSP